MSNYGLFSVSHRSFESLKPLMILLVFWMRKGRLTLFFYINAIIHFSFQL